MRPLILALLLSSACVIRTAPPPGATAAEPAAPSDLGAVEARLNDLLSSNDDLDRRDRLMAAMDLARQARRMDDASRAAVVAYLEQLAAIEARDVPFAAPVVLPPEALQSATGSSMIEEDLDAAPAIAAAPEPAPEAPATEVATAPAEAAPAPAPASPLPAEATDADAPLVRARQQLAANDLEGALASLERCKGQPCWGEAEPLWAETRDRHVFARREAAGARYLASRELEDRAARIDALRLVRDELSELLRRYPDTRYADALARNIALVSQEIAALEGEQPR